MRVLKIVTLCAFLLCSLSITSAQADSRIQLPGKVIAFTLSSLDHIGELLIQDPVSPDQYSIYRLNVPSLKYTLIGKFNYPGTLIGLGAMQDNSNTDKYLLVYDATAKGLWFQGLPTKLVQGGDFDFTVNGDVAAAQAYMQSQGCIGTLRIVVLPDFPNPPSLNTTCSFMVFLDNKEVTNTYWWSISSLNRTVSNSNESLAEEWFVVDGNLYHQPIGGKVSKLDLSNSLDLNLTLPRVESQVQFFPPRKPVNKFLLAKNLQSRQILVEIDDNGNIQRQFEEDNADILDFPFAWYTTCDAIIAGNTTTGLGFLKHISICS